MDRQELTREEDTAFRAWFRGGKQYVIQYQVEDRLDDIFFGKAECEWVSFTECWLKKFVEMGLFIITENRRYIAKGMIGQPEAIEYHIQPTEKGFARYSQPLTNQDE